MNYFANCINVAQIKSTFRELAMLHHPDRGGDVRIMQAINEQYHAALKGQHNTSSFGADGEKHTYYYNETTENQIASVISQLLALNLPNVSIEVIGFYVYVTGDTRPVKDKIKTVMIDNDPMTMQWHTIRKCWRFKPTTMKNYKPRFSKKSLDELADTYGRRTYNSRFAPAR